MKKLLMLLALALAFAQSPTRANPIIEEDFITEIYFGDGEWYILFNNWAFYWFGITSFDEFSIYTNNGIMMIKPEVEPDFSQDFTVITNDDLIQPVELNPESGYLMLEYYSSWAIQDFSWGMPPGKAVGPVQPGQSINWLPMVFFENYEVMWMPIKNASPYFTGGYGLFKGHFQGYLKDHNNNPVTDAEIRYVSPYIMWPNSSFTPLITTTGGYFEKELYAKNYKLSNVIMDEVEYPIDYWLVMEPNTTITMDIMVDMTVGIAKPDKIYHLTLTNFPNPFSDQTTIELKIGDETRFNDGFMSISSMTGATITVIPLSRSKFSDNIFRYKWNSTLDQSLPNGQYLITVTMDNRQVAASKMVVAR